MRLTSSKTISLLMIALLLGIFHSCDRDATSSVFVENKPADRPNPVINSITPADVWLAGVGTITISGSNFSADPGDILVFFGKNKAQIVSASPTEIVVQTPNVVNDSLEVKISVIGAYNFSNTVQYSLQRAIEEIGSYGREREDLYGLAVDLSENLYLSVVLPGAGNQLHQITPAGDKDGNFARLPTFRGDNMRMGPGNTIYFVRRNRNIYRINVDTKSGENWLGGLPDSELDLDFDPDGNIYTAGAGNSLALVRASDNSISTVADYISITAKAVRYYNGYVYVAGSTADNNHVVWRNRVNSVDNLDPAEIVFNLTSALGPNIPINNMEIAGDGDILLAIDSENPVLIVHPDGSYEPLYPGLWRPDGAVAVVRTSDLVWGNENIIYVTRTHTIRDNDGNPQDIQTAVKVNMLKPGATYHGRK